LTNSDKNQTSAAEKFCPCQQPEYQNLMQIYSRGLVSRWVNITKLYFIYTLFGNAPTSQTERQILSLDGSNDAKLVQGCLLHLWHQITQKKYTSMNRNSQAKHTKY